MQIRIFPLQGKDEVTRRIRLERIRQWMELRGWQVMDIAERAESVVFERVEGAPPLGWFDRTRWMPAPGWLAPRVWLSGMMGSPRQMVLGLLLISLVAVAFVFVLQYSTEPGQQSSRKVSRPGETSDRWWFVNADLLNVRASPENNSQILGVLYRNQRVLVEETKNDWVRISSPERGFVSRQFLLDHPLRNE